MNTLKQLLLAKTLFAAAVATASIAAPTLGNAATAGGLSAGVVCRAGYTGNLVGVAFRCSKTVDLVLVLECLDPRFPTYLIRTVVGLGEGRDICLANGINIGSGAPLSGLVIEKDYTAAKVNPATVVTRSSNQDHQEAVALGLTDDEVETLAGTAVPQPNQGVGSKDNARLTLTMFTAPIPNRQIGVGSTAPFAPRPLP